MTLEIIVQDSKTGKAWDISELVSNATWETTLADQPGKLSLEVIKDDKVVVSEGSPVTVKAGGQGIFYGFLFKKTVSDGATSTYVFYDQLRYLKNKDTYVFSGVTASQTFSRLCTDFQIKHRVVSPSSYVCAPKVNDNETLFNMVQGAIDETLMNRGDWYMIRDNFGTLEFVHLNALKTTLFIGDESLATSFEYTSSIDDDSFNQVKLIKENKETQKREVYLVKDSKNIKQWGLLQFFEKMDEKANAAQIKQRADMILKLKNRPTRALKFACIGDLRVRAGNGIVVELKDLHPEGLTKPQYFLVTKCSHQFQGNHHTMDLELQVSV